jgi:hypothetical protein
MGANLMTDTTLREFIMHDAQLAYLFARNVVGDRWPEGEPVVMRHAWAACLYARDVIKSRWLEVEPVIAQDDWAAHQYARAFNLPTDPAQWEPTS